MRLKNELLKRQGIGAALASVSGAVTLAPGGDRTIVDELQDSATSAHGTGVTFLPSLFGRPHPVAVHARGWRPVVQYPVAKPSRARRSRSRRRRSPVNCPMSGVSRQLSGGRGARSVTAVDRVAGCMHRGGDSRSQRCRRWSCWH
ncbi:DUF5937 family protein [Streptomyces griseofuscus]|uniref:DUF5937 family protein n=1 Tax=Streptomyces griseofuscus TaxID=146922 RepID=UPI003F516AAF